MSRSLSTILAAVLVAALASGAEAQQQDKDQQKCLNKVVKTSRKVSGAVLKDAKVCIKKGATGKLPVGVSADQCLTADLKGKVAKSRAKLDKTATKSCGTAPDFGYSDTNTAADAYETENELLSDDGFGSDLDATLAASAGVDPGGRCSFTLPNVWRKVEDSMHREVERCLKAGLKDGTITDAATFEDCLGKILDDDRLRVEKSIALVEKKLLAKCPAGNLDTVFPGLTSICGVYGTGTDAAGIADCSRERLECRLCRILDAAWGLDRDCDLFDDSLANGSCPDCGNTVVDTGEECDDGNEVSGDGCTEFCVDEFCGDGVINDGGIEECDDGVGNSDTTPDACRLDCTDPICGDGVTDTGEECDDGNTDDGDGCTTLCTSCGNGITGGAEQCDDGNTASGDCCSASCTFEAAASPCTGAPDGECTDPGCDGAGSCVELPASNGTPCDDLDDCSNDSECQSGVCEGTSFVVTGQACNWAVVGTPNDGRLDLTQGASAEGLWCGDHARIGDLTSMTSHLVTMKGDGTTAGVELDQLADVTAISVISNNALIDGLGPDNLPDLTPATGSIAPGNVVAKDTSGDYDSTGGHALVSECSAAQTSISTSTATQLDALPSDDDLGATLSGIPNGDTRTINPVNVGGINVIDIDEITGNIGVTINIEGGGDPNTVMILRVAGSVNSNVGWNWNLNTGLTADHLLIYGKDTGLNKCEIGQDNVGAGTLFCPNARIELVAGTTWDGALFGGGTFTVAVNVGQNVVFTHNRFTGL